jgi:hypothetical protein
MAAVRLRKTDAPAREGADQHIDERGAIKDPTRYVH